MYQYSSVLTGILKELRADLSEKDESNKTLYALPPAKSVSQERLRARIRQQYVAAMWEKNRIPAPEEIDSHVFREERASEVYVLPTEGQDAQMIRNYVWEGGLKCKESGSLRKLYRKLGLSDTALARQEKVKVSITRYHPAPFSTDRY